MSNKTTFGMSEDHMGNMNGPLSYGGLPLAISSGYQSNSPPSPETTSPYSSTSPSNLSDLDGNSSPDVYMPDCCVIEDSLCPEFTMLSDVRINLHQTCFTTPGSDCGNVWNQTISLMSTPEMSSLEGNNFYRNSGDTGGDDTRAMTSPESMEGPSPVDSCETSRRCSSENDCCSLSSGELVMRSNSFNLEDETLPLLSSLEESFMSPAMSSGVFIPEGHYASPHLQDVCEGLQDKKSIEGFTVEKTNPACFGMTVIHEDDWEHLAEDEKKNTCNLHVTFPSETELGCTICDSSNSDSGKIAPPSGETSAEAGMPSHLNGTFVQINGNTIVAPPPEEQGSGGKIQTSTPVLHIENHFSLPFFSGSPFSGSTDSPAVCPPQGQQIPQNPKQQLVAKLSSASGKAAKAEIKTFPKPDYSGVKSRIMTRLPHQLATPGTTPANVTQHKSSKMNGHAKPSQVIGKALNKIATAKLTRTTATISQTSASYGVPKEENAVKGNMGKTFIQAEEEDMSAANPSQPRPLSISEDVEGVSRASLRNSLDTGNASSALSTEPSPRSEQTSSGQEVTSTPTQKPANATFCSSSAVETPDKNDHGDDPEPSPKKTEVSHRNGVGSGSAFCRDTPPLAKMRSVDSSTSQSRPSREKKRTSSSSSFNLGGTTRPKSGNLSSSAQNKQDDKAGVNRETPEGSKRGVRKISLVTELPKSKVAEASGSTCDQSESRLGREVRPSPRQSRGLPVSRTTVLSPGSKPVPLPSRQRQQRTTGAIPRATDSLQGNRQAYNGSPHHQNKARSKWIPAASDLQSTLCRRTLPRCRPQQEHSAQTWSSVRQEPGHRGHTSCTWTEFPVDILTNSSLISQSTVGSNCDLTLLTCLLIGSYRFCIVPLLAIFNSKDGNRLCRIAPLRPSSFKTVVLKPRLLAKPPGDTGPTLATSCKSASSNKPGLARSTVTPMRRTISSRIAHLASSLPVDKSKPKASSRQQQQQKPVTHAGQSVGGRVPVPAAVGEEEPSKRLDHVLRMPRELLAASHRRFEAMAVVLQQTLAERDEAVRRRQELSQELVNLQGELVCSTTSCERLEKEKEEVRVSLEDALRRLEEQHHDELAQLEVRLQAFYQAEWDKVHLTYQQEADKCRTLMEQQIGDLTANHEAAKLDLKADHAEHLQDVRRQYEGSLEELRNIQSGDLQSLQKTLKETDDTLSGRIKELMEENNTLVEKLKAEEERRKQLAGKSQKDSHTLYLEQELESLKVVLDIKNKQLHQQEKKILQMDTVVDKSVKLDEGLKKVQQENEELKARMDRHAALSRQLSTEQAVLHESLQKESKVNKRLSMENEELLWKLHNGELGSPRRMSPTSPSHANSFQSPRSSTLFSSPPVSPR
ncbi:Microtubule-associated tumor suppressor 1 A [Merluccius polli]|uniref:Microtubule-associated tumor suppressor 1 A n=1 Tax=Merluccius polli TaxID=89951 RepID=A0AA47P1D2_MERPO|nr:Microtubule-associated tumor suppressor 1 A [Merluccius polli]